MSHIPLADMKLRGVYRCRMRACQPIGVYNGDGKILALREKYGDVYVFAEHHYDKGAPYGTCKPLELLGFMPDDIEPVERLGTIDRVTRRGVVFDRPVSEGGKGWYFTDTGEPATDAYPVSVSNKALYDFLAVVTNENGPTP